MKSRIDKLLVERGLALTRQKAQALILAGQVVVGDERIDKPGQLVDDAADIRTKDGGCKFVGRGGLKLEGALEDLAIDVTGAVGLDVGSSTGGFTDCLLQRGAVKMYAIDVGTNQLDWKLRRDDRVVVREGINARHLKFEDVGQIVDIVVVDVSFISLELILPNLPQFCKAHTEVLLLVKPQFEVGKGQVGKGGIVRDSAQQKSAVEKIAKAAERYGFQVRGSVESRLTGAEGNREFFLRLHISP
ncbi:MAG: TlyA family RNA methyltransferase [Acidobacteriia bacterium]|nr:TlyA family RNA methyltransferase [Terriglobia bacterium]